MNAHERLALFREKLTRLVDNQSELARNTGIDQSAISGMLSGKRRPYADQVAAIARVLGVSLDYLLRDELARPDERPTRAEEGVVAVAREMGVDEAREILRMALDMGPAEARRRLLLVPGEPGRGVGSVELPGWPGDEEFPDRGPESKDKPRSNGAR